MSEKDQNLTPQEKIKSLLTVTDASAIDDSLKALKAGRKGDLPKVDEITKQLDPEQHAVMDKNIRKDKPVKADEGETADAGTKRVMQGGQEKTVRLKWEKVSRVPLGYQHLIVSRAVAFFFGFPVNYIFNSEDKNQITVFEALNRILHDNKEKYFNRGIARELFSFTEVAELWFPVPTETEHELYGFKCKFKLRVIPLKPSEGMELYPFFDESGDMIAFSRHYKRKEGDDDVEYFETYTDDTIYKFKKIESWEPMEGFPTSNIIGKIPIVYAQQPETEWNPVQRIIESDEELVSNFSDTNKYHSSPTIAIRGKVLGFAKKGEAGKVIEMGENADAKYLEWSNASESVKTEHMMNREAIYELSQTPDISAHISSGIGNIGVAAQKMLFFDAHLKVMNKEEILGEYLQRRVNIIKAFIANFNIQLKDAAAAAVISPEITPYMMGDQQETVANVSTAVSGGFMSRKTAIKEAGYVTDVDQELLDIQEEEKAAQALDMFPPAQ